MNRKLNSILLWILAFIITVSVAVYQRMTGPTHPVKSDETFNGVTIKYTLLRTFTEFERMPATITVNNKEVDAWLIYRRYKSNDQWTMDKMTREGNSLIGYVPGQPAAGKVEYSIRVRINNKTLLLNRGKSVVVRFKGQVPSMLLILHIVFMTLSILFALRTGLEALRQKGNYLWMVNWTLGLVFVGGIILGPIVQKYAFGDLWTGFPFGFDLTDNKTLVAFICWIVAFLFKKKNKWWVLGATIIMIVVYLIPHSVLGSELNYQTGEMNNKFTRNTALTSTFPIRATASRLTDHQGYLA